MNASEDRPFVPHYYFAAVTCGLLSMLGGWPFIILRGGFFCMLPGLAERSWRRVIAGFFAGLWSSWMLCSLTGGLFEWDPRWYFNVVLGEWYPHTMLAIATHSRGRAADGLLAVHMSSAIWLVTMALVAIGIGRPPFSSWRTLTRLPLALGFQQALLVLSWETSPMNHFSLPGQGYVPRWALPDPYWVLVPIASVLAFCLTLVWRLNKPGRASRDAEEPQEGEPAV